MQQEVLSALLALSETNVYKSGEKVLKYFEDPGALTQEEIRNLVTIVKLVAEIRPHKNPQLAEVVAIVYNILDSRFTDSLISEIENSGMSPIFMDYWKAEIDPSARSGLEKLPEKALLADDAKKLSDSVVCCFYNKRDASVPILTAAAYYGATKIFRARDKDINAMKPDEKALLAKAAVAGGSPDIMKKVVAAGISLKDCWKDAIQYHRNSAFNWIEKKYQLKITPEMLEQCRKCKNLQLLETLEKKPK